MRFALALVSTALALTASAHAKTTPPASHAVHAPRPAPPLPTLPSVARVRVEAARDRVVVVQEVNLPRGDWRAGHLDLYVAFGAPGTPSAVDARLVAVAAGASESRLEDAGDAVSVEPAVRRPVSAQLLLGRTQMAGVVVHVKDADLRRAYQTSDLATLRIRSLLPAPSADPTGARDVVVRLGIGGGLPLTLARVQIVSLEPQPWIARAEARLCGPDADAWPLSVSLLPKTSDARRPDSPTIAPSMALRHASDDLCVRWWAPP